jgi:hypothetical protein
MPKYRMIRVRALLLPVLLAGCAAVPQLPPPPTPGEIVQMAKDGQPAEAIIQRMRATLAVYPMSASELAKLRAQGVPDAVIDYMQETYVEAVRQQEWARARGGYYGYSAYPWYRPYCWSPYCR